MNPENEKEIIRMWQETALPQPFDPQQLAREIAARVHKFAGIHRRRLINRLVSVDVAKSGEMEFDDSRNSRRELRHGLPVAE
ncbi:MAG: hypothetical protein SGI92_04705 [Bryobacteraceae bacterium]|nr:hypothetical protein [Bryobacteraceae bacterium]